MDDDNEDIKKILEEYYYEYVPSSKPPLDNFINSFDLGQIFNSYADDNKWNYCRGHDLTAILSCLIYNADKREKNIAKIHKTLQGEIIKSVNPDDFKESEVYKFIKRNNL